MPDPLDTLRGALSERYAIDREIGRGGMATVFLARDLKHDRPVAIKVLLPEIAAFLGRERFLREIRTVAQLQHPHVLPLHDSGEVRDADGDGRGESAVLYYVMPFIDGESLRDRLRRERQLPLDDALRITREIADALTAAHARGVVHRDIKPENILFSGTEGGSAHALLTDFGIARAPTGGDGLTLTRAGIAVGTPAYMSPEQASGEHAIDGRSDLYALACVFYEMLAGHPPFLGASAQEVIARHALDPVPPVRTMRSELPGPVDGVLRRAMAKSPADRYASVAEFQRALEKSAAPPRPSLARRAHLGVGAPLLVATAVAIYALSPGGTTAPPGSSPIADTTRSIAVLPFEAVGGGVENEPFGDGVAADLTTELRKIGRLDVKARTSAFSFKGQNLPAHEVGRRLGVRYVLTGSVQRDGSRRRVNAQLIDVIGGNEVWSDRYDGDARAGDVFAVQDTITRAIIASLRVPLSAAEDALLRKRSTADPEAHDRYQQGRFFFEKRDSASLERAKDYFSRAIQRDPRYAHAWAGLADAYSHSTVFGYVEPRAVYARAREAALRALELDSMLVEGHVARGFVALFLEWDFAAAERAFDRAIQLDPRAAPAHQFRAWYLVAANRMDAAVEEMRRAVELDPLSLVINTRLVTMLYYARRYDEAVAQVRRTVEMDSAAATLSGELTRALAFAGRCDEALATIDRARRAGSGIHLAVPGLVLARCGRPDRARGELALLDTLVARGRYVPPFPRALIHAALGNRDEALRELERAVAERTWAPFTLLVEPALDDLRPDPRFSRLVDRVGLRR